jgi:hypothetical protein
MNPAKVHPSEQDISRRRKGNGDATGPAGVQVFRLSGAISKDREGEIRLPDVFVDDVHPETVARVKNGRI